MIPIQRSKARILCGGVMCVCVYISTWGSWGEAILYLCVSKKGGGVLCCCTTGIQSEAALLVYGCKQRDSNFLRAVVAINLNLKFNTDREATVYDLGPDAMKSMGSDVLLCLWYNSTLGKNLSPRTLRSFSATTQVVKTATALK